MDPLRHMSRTWGFRLVRVLHEAPSLLVALVECKGGERVIFRAGPEDAEYRAAVAALRDFGGDGTVRLLREGQGCMLLEHADPGSHLSRLGDDNEATEIVASLMKRMVKRRNVSVAYPTIMDWAAPLFSDVHLGAIASEHLVRAADIYKDLAGDPAHWVLLHGDLHFDNVLSHGPDWIAIDPKGVLGPPIYEVGAWLRNPSPAALSSKGEFSREFETRLRIFNEHLGFGLETMRVWAFAQAVLAAVWMVEDGLDPGEFLQVVRWMSGLQISARQK